MKTSALIAFLMLSVLLLGCPPQKTPATAIEAASKRPPVARPQ